MKNNQIDNSEGLAEMLTDCSIDGIISIDPDWSVTAWNKTAETFTGMTKQVVLGQHLLTAIPSVKEDAETLRAINQALLGFRSFVPASDMFLHRLQVENYFIPLRSQSGTIAGVMNVIHDVAHRIKAEMHLQALHSRLKDNYSKLQQTSAELANFTLISSSNIKEPIRNIYTSIEQLIRTESGRISDNGRASFRRIQSSLNKMNLLLDDMLELARIGLAKKAVDQIDLEQEAKEALKEMAKQIEENNVTAVVNNLCTVTGHRDLIRLLFKQLLSNAIKFNDNAAPLITVDYEKTAVHSMNDGSVLTKEYQVITVTDNGIGIAGANKDRIFNMFEKIESPKRYKGAGTGLAIAKKIMAAHDGFIEVKSSIGEGSSFCCFFPVEGTTGGEKYN